MTQSAKKRKRRSFWEPDSPTLNAWLDAQSDLGTSLQLIIVDAIHRYGEGDVIKAHLAQREKNYSNADLTYSIEETESIAEQKSDTTTAKQQTQKVPHQERDVSEVTLEPQNETPEPEIDLGSDEEEITEDIPFDVSSVMSNAVAEKDREGVQDIVQEPDPLSIMMADIASSINE